MATSSKGLPVSVPTHTPGQCWDHKCGISQPAHMGQEGELRSSFVYTKAHANYDISPVHCVSSVGDFFILLNYSLLSLPAPIYFPVDLHGKSSPARCLSAQSGTLAAPELSGRLWPSLALAPCGLSPEWWSALSDCVYLLVILLQLHSLSVPCM